MSQLNDARNIASGTRLVEAADALLLQGLVDLLPSRAAMDADDRKVLGDLLMSAEDGQADGLLAKVQGHLSGDKERGATAVEYSLLASLIAAVIVGAVTTVGQDVLAMFQSFVIAMP